MSRRSERVGDLLQAEIGQILLRGVHDPRLRLTSVSSVDVSPDLRRAVVRVSVLDPEVCEESLLALKRASGFIRRELAQRLRHMRVVPELVFELDRGAEHSQRISDLLERLHDHDQSA